METSNQDQLNQPDFTNQERPDFLKIICILSFVGCGLMILIFSFGLGTFFLSEDIINKIWDSVLASQPQLESVDRFEFFHNFGMSCVYNLLGNILSLIGVILMWRLNKIGFFIYTFAEIAVNFFGADLKMGSESSSHGGLIFMLLLDLVFIIMYATNLKYMNKKSKGENIAA
jgi:hypothetical protein